jgi:hypothetical protein
MYVSYIDGSFISYVYVIWPGLVVRVPGYRSRGPGLIPGTTREVEVVGLEWGPLRLVSTNWGATWKEK